MPVDRFVDKIIHSPHTEDQQAVGNLVHRHGDDKRLIGKRFSRIPHDPQAL
jgi:hypothetical protein